MVDFFPVLKMFDSQGIKAISATYAKKMLHINKIQIFTFRGHFAHK